MANKIFRSTVLVAAVVLLCSLGVILGVLYNHFSTVQLEQLKNELNLAVTGTEVSGTDFLERLEPENFRLTWIDTDGAVIFDTQVDQSSMENHANRQEIQGALRYGTGSAVRTSQTLTEQTYYEARRLSDGTVLRISASQASVLSLLLGILGPIALIAALAICLSALLAGKMARKIVEPLNSLNLEEPLKNDAYEEVSPLLHRIQRQHNQIREQMAALRRKTDEFEQITGSMQEGLVLLSSEGNILSINPAAKAIFAPGDDCLGKNFLAIDRSAAMRRGVNDALDKGRGFARATKNGREYQFDLSRISSGDAVIGAVLLAFDITERSNAEQLRREFSANVSHELKTPLQGIIGSAELLESGLVKPEDQPRFLGRIHQEAARLVSLIEDIIRLSQLDEGVAIPMEPVDLLELSREVIAVLAPAAEGKKVSLTITGQALTVTGVRRLLYEIIFNLCDNAIKYNVPGGQVEISLSGKSLTVSDTGIGIPPEHQDRVFERFYRVDKSHSKASGGTGLGLSIVKHAATYHGAILSLDSTPGKGTRVTVTFP